jgi:hypothetical protein
MPQSECIKVRLKPGMTDKFVEWARQVSNRIDEAKRDMREQGVLAEHIFSNDLPKATSPSFIGAWKIWQRLDPRFNPPQER